MDFTKLTIKSQEAVAAAQELARRSGNPELYPEHLLLALLDHELPRELVPDAHALRAQAEAALAQKPRIAGAQQQPGVSAAFSTVLVAHETTSKDEAEGNIQKLPYTGSNSSDTLAQKLMGMVDIVGYTAVVEQEGQPTRRGRSSV